jgi:chromosome partitioning protein
MSVIAVVNRKGGSGKSTLATHLAAYCALRGASVAIGDIDRQQSTRAWLRQRKSRLAADAMRIAAWQVDPRSFVRPPTGIDHVVVDTPGGLTGLDLARVVMYADAIVVPVGASIFDRDSAGACLAELRTLPRVASGRCRVAAVGMRVDARTEAADVLLSWSEQQQLPLIAVLPQSHAYVHCIDRGLTLFDLPLAEIEAELAHWKPLLQWLRPLVRPAANAEDTPMHAAAPPARAAPASLVEQPKPSTLRPSLPAREPGAGGTVAGAARPVAVGSEAPKPDARRSALSIPAFLHRRS